MPDEMTEVPSYVNEAGTIRLLASRDRTSGECVFPKLPDRSPAAGRYETVTLSPVGVLYSYTIIHPSPRTGEPDYILGYIDFPEQARVLGELRLGDGATPQIGMPVRVEETVVSVTGTDGSPRYVFVSAAGSSAT